MKKIAFISDYFISDGSGGAELTTDAIMRFGAERGFEIFMASPTTFNMFVVPRGIFIAVANDCGRKVSQKGSSTCVASNIAVMCQSYNQRGRP